MKKFLLSAGLILGAIVNANAALLTLEVFEDNNLIIAFGPVSGGMIGPVSGSTPDFSNIGITITGDSFFNLELDVSATSNDFTGTHNLTIEAIQSQLTPPLPAFTLTSNFSATSGTDTTVQFGNRINAGLIANATFIGGGQATVQTPVSLNILAQYTETLILSMDAAGKDTITGRDIVTGVPEPSTWLMMLAGFIGLGLFFSRKGSRLAKLAA